jgi:hypothetical protein
MNRVNPLTVKQNAFSKGRLSGVDMGADADIPYLGNINAHITLYLSNINIFPAFSISRVSKKVGILVNTKQGRKIPLPRREYYSIALEITSTAGPACS